MRLNVVRPSFPVRRQAVSIAAITATRFRYPGTFAIAFTITSAVALKTTDSSGSPEHHALQSPIISFDRRHRIGSAERSCMQVLARASRSRIFRSRPVRCSIPCHRTQRRYPSSHNFMSGQIGPENSRTYDAGIDQQLSNGRARVGLTYFHNEYTNGIEFVPQSGLAELGVPPEELAALEFGAYVNSESFRTQGFELEAEYRINSRLFARGGYTYTDACGATLVLERSGGWRKYQSEFS